MLFLTRTVFLYQESITITYFKGRRSACKGKTEVYPWKRHLAQDLWSWNFVFCLGSKTLKTIPCSAAHTRLGQIKEWSQGARITASVWRDNTYHYIRGRRACDMCVMCFPSRYQTSLCSSIKSWRAMASIWCHIHSIHGRYIHFPKLRYKAKLFEFTYFIIPGTSELTWYIKA